MEPKTHDLAQSKINFLVGPQEPLVAAVKRQKLAWFGMSHTMTASPKPSFRAPWRMGDTMVGRGNAERQHQRGDISANARTAHNDQKISGLARVF